MVDVYWNFSVEIGIDQGVKNMELRFCARKIIFDILSSI